MDRYVNGMIKIRCVNNLLARNAMIIHNLIKMGVIWHQSLATMTKAHNYALRYLLKGKIVLEDSTN